MFLPLHWVVVHPIDEESPLWNARFIDMYRPPEHGLISVDLSKISDVEQLG